MKIIFSRQLVVVSAALLIVACATPRHEWKPAGYYVTNQRAYGCDSFEGKKGVVVKQTAVLALGLQRKLLGLLDQAASADKDLQKKLDYFREALLCWFETPEKDIELNLGAFCDGPFEVIFHARGEEWIVTSADWAIVTCSPGRR